MSNNDDADPLKNPPGHIEDYLELEVRKLKKQTRVNRRGALRRYIRWLDEIDTDRLNLTDNNPHSLRPLDIERYLTDLEKNEDDNYATGTIRHHIAAVRDYYRWASEHYGHDNIAKSVNTDHLDHRTKRSKLLDEADVVEYLGLDEIRALIDNASNSRERIVITLLIETGCRAGELRRLKTSAIDLKAQLIEVPNSKEMLKKEESRDVPVLQHIADDIREWINIDRYLFPKSKSKYLIPGKTGNQIRTEEISDIVREAAERAGIQILLNKEEVEENGAAPIRKVRAHTCRHTFAVHRVKGPSGDGRDGIDLAVLADLMGHKNVQTTRERYLGFKKEDYSAMNRRTAPRY